MSKIIRKTSKIFGLSAGANQIAQFGSLNAGTPAFSTDPSTIQALANWQVGWFNAVENTNSPAIEDMNAVNYVNSYQVSYLFQAGIAEWDSGTTYYIGSLANSAGQIYVSQVDNNLNNLVTNTSDWLPYLMTIPVGSAGAPSLAFSGDTTTGFFSGTSVLRAAVSGVTIFSINSGGIIISGNILGTYFQSSAANPASAGTVRLNNTDAVKWRNSGNSGDIALQPGSSDAVISYGGIDLVNLSTSQTLSNKTIALKGLTDGSLAASGIVGEILDAYSGGGGSPAFVNATGNGQFFDVASLSLTAGDWDIYLQGEASLNGATSTEMSVGVNTTTGNSGTGLTNGSNFIDIPLPISTDNVGFSLPWHVSISTTTIYYLKGFASYSAGTPKMRGYIWARRRR